MKRREFNAGLVAASAAPILPVPKVAAAAPAAAAANFTPFMYASGAQFARLHGSCSPELLAARFGLPSNVASAINARLIKQGIVTAPNALGLCQSTDKYAPAPSAQDTFSHSDKRPDAVEMDQKLDFLDDDCDLIEPEVAVEPASPDTDTEELEAQIET